MAYQSPRHSQSFYQYDASTPPPPPPKPGVQSSHTATSTTGPPLPPPPGQAQAYNDQQQDSQNYSQADQLAVQPPEDGWLPDILRDKTYARSATLQLRC
jgi:hypothetical protein